MAPIFGTPNYDFPLNEEDYYEQRLEGTEPGLTEMAFWYTMVLVAMLLIWLTLFFCLRILALRQKTRNPQQRRLYVGSRARPSLAQQEPTIFVSPSNLPPPPKYECMAPPSYEEVVGVHYPNYQMPITQPITSALAQSSSENRQTNNSQNDTAASSETVITVPTETVRAADPARS